MGRSSVVRVELLISPSCLSSMSVYQFRDSTFLCYKSLWFVWESTWERYRPVDALRWNGTRFEIEDTRYTHDLADPLYGYETASMKELCDRLSSMFPPSSAKPARHLIVGPPEWFRDRMVCLNPCAPRDTASWKKMCQGRHRTCRKGPRNKFTKRNSLHDNAH